VKQGGNEIAMLGNEKDEYICGISYIILSLAQSALNIVIFKPRPCYFVY
jgi:hypothetical protein